MINYDSVCDFCNENNIAYQHLGNTAISINDFCSIGNLKNNSLTWIKNKQAFDYSKIDPTLKLVIITDDMPNRSIGDNILLLICDNSKYVFFGLLEKFFSQKTESGISKNAAVKTNEIGQNVSIGNFSYINSKVIIGNNVKIENNVSILSPCKIGDGCIIHSGVVIGADGFGYSKQDDCFNKVLHFGGVKIGNNVEIGANTCIDRGTIDDTIISDGVKIDNLCHIAHNVIIEKNSMVIALSMIAGSTRLCENTYIAPGAMIMNQLIIGANSLVGMGAVVVKDVEANKVVAGVPAKVIKDNI